MAEAKDHVINERDTMPTTPVARWDANIGALRIVKELDAQKRRATADEQKALGQYSGFGDSAFEPAFSPYRISESAWKQRREELEHLVSAEEFEGIKRSRLNAFYTSPEIVATMWKGLSDMGADKLDKPRVLEPSAGSGRFLGLQPPEMAARSERTAVELDPLTADILRHLYPETRVYSAGFQDAPLPDDHFDVAISNVPFGDINVYDPEFNATGRKHLTRSVHNYFFAKTLDKLRPGGVMAYITTHHTMDAKKAKAVREYLAEQADLVGAVRLPEDAFPDTQVVTDILYLRKRVPGEEPGDADWVETEEVEAESRYGRSAWHPVNRYFANNPDKVLGSHSTEGSMYRGDSYTVKSGGKFGPAALGREIGEITREARIPSRGDVSAPSGSTGKSPKVPQKYVVVDGELHVSDGAESSKHDLAPEDATRVTALVGIRDTARHLVSQEAGEADNDTVGRTRESLRQQYDAYLDEYGEAVNTPTNRTLMARDADSSLLFALETYDKDTECWQPADIMHQRVIGAAPTRKVATASDAMQVTLHETGRLDFEHIAGQLDKSPAEVREELAREKLIFRSPTGLGWLTADDYLSGNVRERLKAARIAAANDVAYRTHVEALEGVLPTQVEPEDIATPLGAPWIPADVINAWIDDTIRPYTRFGRGSYFRYDEEGEAFIAKGEKGQGTKVGASGKGGWTLAEKINAPDAVMRHQWGTPAMSAKDILLHTLQGAPISLSTEGPDGKRVQDQGATLAAQEKATEMQRSFDTWVWADESRKVRLADLYNETHNATRARVFDGSHQTFPGMAVKWRDQLRPHQRDAIHRVVNDGTALLAHEVGFGKTATMVAAAMERKRLGLALKPVFVVPKATGQQFVGQFRDVYPGAKLLTPDDDDFKAEHRDQFLSRIATGDWDGVILTSEQFQRIPLSPQTEARWIRQQHDEMAAVLQDMGDRSATREVRQTQKQMQKRLENYQVRLKQLHEQMRRDEGAQSFEDLGIDQLYVDEADRYKNLPYVTRMAAGRGGVKGLPQSESLRAWDMYMKIRHLQDRAGSKPDGSFTKGGVVFATGTPIANTIAEAWTMMRYLQPAELKRRGLSSFDAWAKTYGEIASGIEQTAQGTYRPVQRFSQFVNLPELSRLFQNVADIRVASEVPEMLAVQPRLMNGQGENKRITVVAPPHPALKEYMADIVKRVDELRTVSPEEDNMLKISSDARKASLDVRMVDPKAPHNPEGKIPLAAQNIAEIYTAETADKGTQFVFLDLGTPKAKDIAKDDDAAATADGEDLTADEQHVLTNVYATLRKELAANGVPEDQVAFIHDYKTPEAREELFDEVRKGDVRVLVGSTEKIGVGVNVQDRAAAAHHIDVPWRPRDVEQREGRIIRQGNTVYGPRVDEETGAVLSPGRGVQIFQYVQEGSFDGFMWQAIESKARAIKSLMKRQQDNRRMDDIDPFILGVAEAKALASGNPLVKRAEELKLKATIGRAARAAHLKQVGEASLQKTSLVRHLADYRDILPRLEKDAQHVASLPEGAEFSAVINGKHYEKRLDAAQALESALAAVKYSPDPQLDELGIYKGFAVAGSNTDQGYQLVMSHPVTQQPYHTGYVEKGEITPNGLMSRLDNVVKGVPDRVERTREKLAEAERSLRLYEEQMDKPFGQSAQLDRAEAQLRVIQARLSNSTDDLRVGDNMEMDVMSDGPPSESRSTAAATPREIPDVDSMTLQVAAEAVRAPESADTPGEVADVLEDALESGAQIAQASANAKPTDESQPSSQAPKIMREVVEPDDESPTPEITSNPAPDPKPADQAVPRAEQEGRKPKPALPSVSLESAAEKVQAKLQDDRAYQNALANADDQNTAIEYTYALERALGDLFFEDETDLFAKRYESDQQFRDQLTRQFAPAPKASAPIDDARASEHDADADINATPTKPEQSTASDAKAADTGDDDTRAAKSRQHETPELRAEPETTGAPTSRLAPAEPRRPEREPNQEPATGGGKGDAKPKVDKPATRTGTKRQTKPKARSGPQKTVRIENAKGHFLADIPVDRHGNVPAKAALERMLDVRKGGRPGRLRNPKIDNAKSAKVVARSRGARSTEEEKRLQYRWYLRPNQLDMEGIDTAGALDSLIEREDRPAHDGNRTPRQQDIDLAPVKKTSRRRATAEAMR